MDPILDPFPPNATATVHVTGSQRPTSLVVFDTNGCTLRDHPAAGTRYSMLMILGGYGDLTRVKPKILASQLLALPDVVPPQQRGRGPVEVPLLRPDTLENTSYTTWTIVTTLLMVDQIGADQAQLTVQSPANARDVHTLELGPCQWWHLIQALVSLDAWMQYLRGRLEECAKDVRQALEPPVALRPLDGTVTAGRDEAA
jgi:hypothetical protein